jgi:hypothetical protein
VARRMAEAIQPTRSGICMARVFRLRWQRRAKRPPDVMRLPHTVAMTTYHPRSTATGFHR